jgi:hypothetical protein
MGPDAHSGWDFANDKTECTESGHREILAIMSLSNAVL